MSDSPLIRILTVDDHAILRKGIAGLVSAEPDMELIGEASTGMEAIQQFRQYRPDVTLMDLLMPDMGGIEAIIAIRNEFPEARIIVLTTYAGDVQVVRALKAGARLHLEGQGQSGTVGDHPIGARRVQAHPAGDRGRDGRACRR